MTTMRIAEHPYYEICRTVGSKAPETGGILLGSRQDYVVRRFYFDPHGSCSPTGYDPAVDYLNPIVKQEWATNGLQLLGFVHSHPRGVRRLSSGFGGSIGDLAYLHTIFAAMPALERFLVPIIFSAGDRGPFQIFPYIAERGREADYRLASLLILREDDLPPLPLPTPDSPAPVKATADPPAPAEDRDHDPSDVV